MERALRAHTRALVRLHLTPVKLALYRQRQALRRLERRLAPMPPPRPRHPPLPPAQEAAILRWMFDE